MHNYQTQKFLLMLHYSFKTKVNQVLQLFVGRSAMNTNYLFGSVCMFAIGARAVRARGLIYSMPFLVQTVRSNDDYKHICLADIT